MTYYAAMTNPEYILAAMWWSVVGFFLGYLVGVLRCHSRKRRTRGGS